MSKSGSSAKKNSARKGSSASRPRETELLLEIGTEELPYQFIAPALRFLHDGVATMLQSQRLPFGQIRSMGTPRRLVLMVEQLATQQQSGVKETLGPSKAVAFDQAGHATKAGIGFAASQGVPVEELQIRHTPKGDYVCAVKQEKGQSTPAVLTQQLSGLIGKLSFPKTMQWNETGVRFARPVRWLVALCGGEILPIEYAGVKAGRATQGHRFLDARSSTASHGFPVRTIQEYLKETERHGVVIDQERRRAMIVEQLSALAKSARGQLYEDNDLLEQAVYTVEYPHTIMGSFKADYLALPKEILMTAMKEHQGYFSLVHPNGALLANFLTVTNMNLPNMKLIREGNERVLAARLADATFFYEEDRKIPLVDRLEKLKAVTFHQKLGTLHEKTTRNVELSAWLANRIHLGADDQDLCRRAAQLGKADLISGMVGEFPNLQGIMGAEYARHDGEAEEVCKAIGDQYLPRGMEGGLPATIHGRIVALADRLDTIVAFFRAGIVPKGSEDPFALRRHALSIVRILIEGSFHLNLDEAVHAAEEISERDVKDNSSMLSGSPLSFIFERFRFYAGINHELRDDVVAAVCDTAYAKVPLDLGDVLERAMVLQTISARPDFDPLIVGFKRAHRLTQKEQWNRTTVDPSLFDHPAEIDLHKAWQMKKDLLGHLKAERQYASYLTELVSMKSAIDDFFTNVMVNADNSEVRSNRLSLLKNVDELFMAFADFSQIVVQGS